MRKEDDLLNIWLNSLSGFYDLTYFVPIIPFINRFLIDNNLFSGTLLDIGCGFGKKAHAFQQIGFTVTGIDGDQERIDWATENFPQMDFRHFRIVDILPFADQSFDVVFSHSVFQYLEHRPVLEEIHRILKPKGSLIMVENLKSNPITRLGRAYHKRKGFNFHSYPYNHFTFSEMEELKTEFSKASTRHFHLLTPASHLNSLRRLYPLLHSIDLVMLKFLPLRHISWLALFTGNNERSIGRY